MSAPIATHVSKKIMSLERELKKYDENLPSLLPEAGRFVVIHEDRVLGVFDTYEDALRAGYHELGVTPFLVRQIQAIEQIHYFSRDLSACQS